MSSTTVTVALQLFVAPKLSVAVKVTESPERVGASGRLRQCDGIAGVGVEGTVVHARVRRAALTSRDGDVLAHGDR